MKIGKLVIFLFLIIFLYLVRGKVVKREINDCDKILPFLRDKYEDCCKITGIICDNEGYLLKILL